MFAPTPCACGYAATRNRVWPDWKSAPAPPHHIPHKTPPEVEQQVVEARDAIPCFGPRRLKRYFELPCSTGAIARILQQSGRSQRRKKPRPPSPKPGR
jgi:hypothetical protein